MGYNLMKNVQTSDIHWKLVKKRSDDGRILSLRRAVIIHFLAIMVCFIGAIISSGFSYRSGGEIVIVVPTNVEKIKTGRKSYHYDCEAQQDYDVGKASSEKLMQHPPCKCRSQY
ncbi:MAG: hypothetical protein R2827_14470 [Bdellovibrionales bacterium]